jgi:heme exporter protein A
VTAAPVRVEGLGRLYEDSYALVDLTADFPVGTATALLGPNGAGKSTLIGILSSRLRPSEGAAWLGGASLDRPPPALRAQIGYLGHRTMIYGELTARENLRFFAGLYGLGVPERVDPWLARVGLAEVADRPASGFSRGMLQRLALARVLLPEPQLLLLDEPLTGLDQAGVALALDLFAEARGRGAVVIMASHDLPATARVCDRALVLVGGRRRFLGPTGEGLVDVYHAALAPRRTP